MAKFTLTQGTDSYEFDTSGTGAVKKNGAAFGTWTTDAANKLVARSTDGAASVPFTVVWKFNNNNELTLLSGTSTLLNFDDGQRPRYDVVNSVLMVKPEFTGRHQFAVQGEWDLGGDGKLTLTTLDGQKSTLDGLLNDVRSRFVYRISSKTPGREDHTALLLFVGRWRKDPADPLKLNFLYKRTNGTEDTFVLPGDFSISPGDNKLIYRFTAGTRTHEIKFVGSLRVSPDFQISYSINNQIAQGSQTQVFATEIVVEAVFANPSFEGTLQLAVKRPNGGETIFSISGQFTHIALGSTNLGIGFAISGGTGATPTVMSINGKFSFKQGTELQFSFEKNAKNMTIGISATQIKLGNFAVADATGTIKLADGRLQSVEVMFGFTFPMKRLNPALAAIPAT